MARVIVVGGGIAGLGAAWQLQNAGVEVEVLESESEAGGRMRSRFWNGAWIDRGAEFITSNDEGFEKLAGEVGVLADKVSYPGKKVGFHIWRNGAPHYVSYTEPMSILRTKALTASGKLRMLGMLPTIARQFRRNGGAQWEPWRAAWCDDESVEQWLNRVNPDFLEYLVEPCYELYCGYEPHEFGKAFFAYLSTVYRSTEIFTFKEGLGQLTRAVAARLDVTTNARVKRVVPGEPRVSVEVEVDGKSERRDADWVVVATPGTKVGGIVDGLDPARRTFFESVRYTPHELPFFTLSHVPPGTPTPGVFYPRKEDAAIASVGYDVSSTNPDVSFFRVSMKTSHIQSQLGKSDDEDLDAILAEASRRYPDVVNAVSDRYVSRWPEALPLFPTGYLKALGRFMALPPMPGVSFAGDYLAGPATGAAYATGLRAAAEVQRMLS
jgi:oxygen-dependent protoporphyrinogen oxidase